MTFGEKLRALRKSLNLTQEELASRCGVSKQNISRYEKSDREPSIKTAKTIADALGVSLEDLASDVKKAPVAEDGLSEKKKEFIRLVSQLTDEEAAMLSAQLRGLLRDR